MTTDKKKLLEQLDALKLFPNNKLVQKLRKQIKLNLEKMEKSKTIEKNPVEVNFSRSKGLKKYHRYIRLIRNSFPNLKYSEIRKQFFLRKQGKEVSIPDAIWQNASP